MGSPSQSIKDRKSQIRAAWKKNYPQDQDLKRKASQELCRLIIQQRIFKEAKNICLFAARPWEIDLLYLFELFPRTYCFPKVDLPTKTMNFHLISNPKELQTGVLGILEPSVSHPICTLSKADLVLVPGFAFDWWGYRIGSGGGYYDRFFFAQPDIPRWGVCFHQQISKLELAHTDHDARMNAIVSECGFFIAKKVE